MIFILQGFILKGRNEYSLIEIKKSSALAKSGTRYKDFF